MKYKVGDKVRVRSDLKENTRYGEQIFSPDMRPFLGKIVEISEILIEDSYHIKETEGGYEWFWTDEMFEPVEEMSAADAIKAFTEICCEYMCCDCPIWKIDKDLKCNEVKVQKPEKVVEVLKQWKADHEKKPIETEFAWYVQIIEADTHTLKHEEKVETDIKSMDAQKAEILKKYCSEHDGKYYAISERRCVVKG